MSWDVTDFDRDVLERSRTVPVLVDFWAEWCGPCRVLGPILERLAGEASGRWVLAKLDTERFPEIAQRYGIMSIPNVKLFAGGEVVDEFVGALPEAQVRRWIVRALPSPQAAVVAEAEALIQRGAFAEAAERLRGVVDAEPRNLRARVGLGEALLHLDPDAVAATVRDAGENLEFGERAEALTILARVVTAAEAPDRLPDAPPRARFLEAGRAIRAADYGAALEAIVEVLRLDRDFADGLAKAAGRAIFVLLGVGHPVSERYHRAFSSALHV